MAILVGNWKMNLSWAQIQEFLKEFSPALKDSKHEAWIAPQMLHLPLMLNERKNTKLKLGAQNCASHQNGAFTGEVSPVALKELGADFVIIGHSERRSLFHEIDSLLNQKAQLALSLGLKIIFCIGETQKERDENKTDAVILDQLRSGLKGLKTETLSQVLIAYEPVWAIGTGLTATPEMAQAVHQLIRRTLPELGFSDPAKTPLLYGGSVKPESLAELLSEADIDGALIGGASLKAVDFARMMQTPALAKHRE